MPSYNSEERVSDSDLPVEGLDRNIPFAEKLLFPAVVGVGALLNAAIQTYLAIFNTNIQRLEPAYFQYMLVIQITAAALIPFFGAFVDRHTTRWGKYRPWVFIVMSGAGVGAFLAFIPVNLGPAGNFAYAMVTYAFLTIFLSAVYAVVPGMTAAMTKRYDDRLQLAFSGAVWAAAGSLSVAYLSVPIVNSSGKGDRGNGFQYLALLCMAIAVVLTLLLIRLGKERFSIPAQKQTKFSLVLLAKALFKNKYALIAVSYSLILPLNNIRASFNIYYCMNVFHDTKMMGALVLLATAPELLGLLLSPFVTKKLGMKNNLLMIMFVNIVASAAIFFVPATSFGAAAVYALTGIGSLFMGLAGPVQRAMIPFAADYGEVRFNTNTAGFLASVDSLARQLGIIFRNSAVITGLFFSLSGYTPAGTPSPTALVGIKLSVSFLPALIFVILALIVARWDMTREKHREIVEEARARE